MKSNLNFHYKIHQDALKDLFYLRSYGPNVSTTPLRQWGFRQCLPFSWTTRRGKHCRHPIAVMGVVDTFGHDLSRATIQGVNPRCFELTAY